MAEWLRLRLRVAPQAVETVAAELWSLGTLGFEQRASSGEQILEAYFDASRELPALLASPGSGFWERRGAVIDSSSLVAEQDWLAEYRRHAEAFPLGRHFLVDPSEPGEGRARADDRWLLRLPARRAFGTGSHDSTRLVIDWLEQQDLDGCRVLDVGTGTGILSMAALLVGAPSVVAVEIDPAAAFMAYLNQGLNQVSFPLVAGGVGALSPVPTFDLALINVLPQHIAADLRSIADLIERGGLAVFSGLLQTSMDDVASDLEKVGFSTSDRLSLGEWGALVVRREAA